eukprot:Em0001g3026a
MAAAYPSLKEGFQRVNLYKTVWDVPSYCTDLSPIGTGAYRTVCSATNTTLGALKKLTRPFQSEVHAKWTYRELRYLKHMKHENDRKGTMNEDNDSTMSQDSMTSVFNDSRSFIPGDN